MKKICLAISAIAFFLQGCAGGARPTAAAGNLSGTTVLAQKSVFNAFLNTFQLSAQPAFPGTNSLPGLMASIYDPCTTFLVGSSFSDSHYKAKYDCNKVDAGGGVYKSLVGTKEMYYYDQTKKDLTGGYEFSYDLQENGYPTTAEPYEDAFKGSAKAVVTATSITRSHDVQAHIKGKDTFVLDWGFYSTLEQTITPDDMTNIYNSGSMKFSGFYKLSGLMGGDMNGNMIPEISVTYEIKSQDLTYDNSCARYYKTGTITLKDSANSLVMTFSCATATVTFNGTTLAWF